MRIVIPIIVIAFFISCGGNSTNKKPEAATKDTTTFFAIPETIAGEIAEIKRVPTVIYELVIENNKKDSLVIDTTILQQLATPFLQLNLNAPSIKTAYTETIFEDGDTRSFVLNYTTTHTELPIKSVSVMLDNETQKLKRIDVIKSYLQNDTSYQERLAWIANKNFQLIRIATAGKSEITRHTLVIWGNSN